MDPACSFQRDIRQKELMIKTKTPEREIRSGVLVGPAGFEPTDGGVKVLCLTAWRRPIIKKRPRSVYHCAVFGGVPREIRTLGLQSHNLAR